MNGHPGPIEWDPDTYEDPRSWSPTDPEIKSLWGNPVLTSEGVMDERQALKRVMTGNLCWKCARHPSASDIGLCEPCRSELVA